MSVESTWREQDVILNENAPTEVYFQDTEPNHILFTNPTSNSMYVSISPSVSPTYHEMVIAPGGTKMFARPSGLKQIYIYHSSNIFETIRVVSFVDTFTVTSVSQTSEIVNTQQLTGDMNIVSLPPLPAGGSRIGTVNAELVGDLISAMGLRVDLQGGTITISNATIGDMACKIASFALQTDQTIPGEGTPISVANFKNVTVEIIGSSTAQQVNFWGKLTSGTKIPLSGVNISTLETATQTTGINEIWQFDVTGLESVLCEIISVSGGSLSVNGKAVA